MRFHLAMFALVAACSTAPVDTTDASDTLAATAGPQIKYIVVLVKENHTFDNLFTGFPGATSSATAKLSTGATYTRPAAPIGQLPGDIGHSHGPATTAFRGGAMTGFDLVNGGAKKLLPFIRYTEHQIPNYWTYARTFTLADHFFSTTLANSFPGHFAIMNGWSPALNNPTCTSGHGCNGSCTVQTYNATTGAITDNARACWNTASLIGQMPAWASWAEYGPATLDFIQSVAARSDLATHLRGQSQLLADLMSPDQPNLIVDHIESSVSEHPDQDICPGENDTTYLVNAIMQGPHWNETAILITWDDWGGFYDSVKPPAKRLPNGDYMNVGFRLPLLVISPYARPGFVFHGVSEQASIPRLVEELWSMSPRLHELDAHARDDEAGSLLGAFDFTQAPLPPRVLPPHACHYEPALPIAESSAAVSWDADRLDVFIEGSDHLTWHKAWSGTAWTGWGNLGGPTLAHPPISISRRPGTLDVFAPATTGEVWHRYYDGSQWLPWKNLGGTLADKPRIVSWGNDRIDIFGTGTDKTLQHTYWTGSAWGAWESLGGQIVGVPAVTAWAPGRLDLVVRGATANLNLFHLHYQSGTGWGSWENLGGGPIPSDPAMVSWSANRLDIFTESPTHSLQHMSWNGHWSAWGDLGGVITSPPDAVAWGENRLDVVALGSGSTVFHKAWTGSSWTGWGSLGQLTPGVPRIASWAPNRLDLFAMDSTTASLKHLSWNGAWSTWGDLGGTLGAPP